MHSLQSDLPPSTPKSPANNATSPAPTAHSSSSLAPTSAATDIYWARLSALLNDAHTALPSLHASPDHPPSPNHGALGRLAHLLQGRTPSETGKLIADQPSPSSDNSSSSYADIIASNAVGQFVDYGVPEAHIAWVAHCLDHASPSSIASVISPPNPPISTQDRIRVRVFEAELVCLSAEDGERVARSRRTMRRFRSRIDTCVRILLGMEGRGRRLAPASLDRLKLSLEKLDRQARTESVRLAAQTQQSPTPTRKEKPKTPTRRGPLPTPERRKRSREMNAQASFMKRFVKARTEPTTKAPTDVTEEYSGRTGSFAAPVANDPDVMTVSWWLYSEMHAVPLDEFYRQIAPGSMAEVCNVSALHAYLRKCGARRETAEQSVHAALEAFRKRRTDNLTDRTPRFIRKRVDCRGRGPNGPIKLLQFSENHRPAFYGTRSERSKVVRGRRPLGKDDGIDYDYDSEEEWDDDEDGEDLMDVEADKMDRMDEDEELKRLYGSDSEGDDDFFDDGDVVGEEEDDEDDSVEETVVDAEGTKGAVGTAGTPSPDGSVKVDFSVVDGQTSTKAEGVDLTISVAEGGAVSKNISGKKIQKDNGRRLGKRRKNRARQSVVIEGVSFPKVGEASPMDRFAASVLPGVQAIQMFNPFVYHVSDMMAEHLKPKATSLLRPSRTTMDESAKLDLAVALSKGGSSRDRIVYDFCEHRKIQGLDIPSKSEILRTINEMATREKREGDTRAGWYLNDYSMAIKVEQMGVAVQNESKGNVCDE